MKLNLQHEHHHLKIAAENIKRSGRCLQTNLGSGLFSRRHVFKPEEAPPAGYQKEHHLRHLSIGFNLHSWKLRPSVAYIRVILMDNLEHRWWSDWSVIIYWYRWLLAYFCINAGGQVGEKIAVKFFLKTKREEQIHCLLQNAGQTHFRSNWALCSPWTKISLTRLRWRVKVTSSSLRDSYWSESDSLSDQHFHRVQLSYFCLQVTWTLLVCSDAR